MKKYLFRYLTILIAATISLFSVHCVHAAGFYEPDEYEMGFIATIPLNRELIEEVEHKGTVERLTYTTHSYALEAVAAGTAVKLLVTTKTTLR